jgi:hypothetical protein
MDSSNEVSKRIPARGALERTPRHPHEERDTEADVRVANCTVTSFRVVGM